MKIELTPDEVEFLKSCTDSTEIRLACRNCPIYALCTCPSEFLAPEFLELAKEQTLES